MIEKMAGKIALTIKKANPTDTASVEVMKFSLIMLIGTGSAIAFSMIISFILGHFWDTVLVLFSFSLLRLFSGGYHFKSAEYCTVASVLLGVLVPYIHLNDTLNVLLLVCNCVIVFILAPEGKNQSRIFNESHYPMLKGISIAIVLLNLWIMSDVVTVSFFIQSLTLIVSRLKGGENR